MRDPRRIQEDNASAVEHLLLGSARLDVPRPGSKARLLAGLGVATASGAAAAATSGATAAWTVSKWAALGMLAGTVATGSVEVIRAHLDSAGARPDAPVASGAVASPPHHVEATRAVASATIASAPPVVVSRPALAHRPAFTVDGEPPRSSQPSSPSPSVPSLPAPASPAPSPALADEIGALDRARQSLQARDASSALRTLEAFEASFPNARLRPEARMLRMEALLEVGNYHEARAIGRGLLEADPSSALAQRVRTLLRNVEARGIQPSPSGH